MKAAFESETFVCGISEVDVADPISVCWLSFGEDSPLPTKRAVENTFIG
jgi:hypothetical protein